MCVLRVTDVRACATARTEASARTEVAANGNAAPVAKTIAPVRGFLRRIGKLRLRKKACQCQRRSIKRGHVRRPSPHRFLRSWRLSPSLTPPILHLVPPLAPARRIPTSVRVLRSLNVLLFMLSHMCTGPRGAWLISRDIWTKPGDLARWSRCDTFSCIASCRLRQSRVRYVRRHE